MDMQKQLNGNAPARSMKKKPTKQKMQQAKDYFPSMDFINVKGKAPLLLPHPGTKETWIWAGRRKFDFWETFY